MKYLLPLLPKFTKRPLEVGAGSARLSRFLTLRGLRTFCLDYSTEALTYARTYYERENADSQDVTVFPAIIFPPRIPVLRGHLLVPFCESLVAQALTPILKYLDGTLIAEYLASILLLMDINWENSEIIK